LRQFYESKTSKLRNKYGRYLLINTNFGTVNHYFGRDYIADTLRQQGKIKTQEQESEQNARENHQDIIMQAFIDMIPQLCRNFPQHKVIVRPHPSEDFDTWKRATAGLPGAFMIHQGDVVPWLMGADAVVHNSCTTGLQAYLLEKPVISYMPVVSDKYDQYLPNALSEKVHTMKDLVNQLREATASPEGYSAKTAPEKRRVMQEFIASQEGPWASDLVMDELEKINIPSQSVDPEYFESFNQSPGIFNKYKKSLKNIIVTVSNQITKDGHNKTSIARKNWQTYTNQRFPSMSLRDVQADLKRLQKITGRFDNVKAVHLGGDLVCIYPENN
jgi:hypothetical protein